MGVSAQQGGAWSKRTPSHLCPDQSPPPRTFPCPFKRHRHHRLVRRSCDPRDSAPRGCVPCGHSAVAQLPCDHAPPGQRPARQRPSRHCPPRRRLPRGRSPPPPPPRCCPLPSRVVATPSHLARRLCSPPTPWTRNRYHPQNSRAADFFCAATLSLVTSAASLFAPCNNTQEQQSICNGRPRLFFW